MDISFESNLVSAPRFSYPARLEFGIASPNLQISRYLFTSCCIWRLAVRTVTAVGSYPNQPSRRWDPIPTNHHGPYDKLYCCCRFSSVSSYCDYWSQTLWSPVGPQAFILYKHKGSAWAPASAGAHASGRAGQHFDNLRCSCQIWHASNFKVMPRV